MYVSGVQTLILIDDWDGICIAAIEVTYPDDGKAIIYGDVPFHLCGWTGYPSITDFPLPGVSSSGYHPYCFWLDSDNSNDIGSPKSVHFHIPDFNANNLTVDAYNANYDLVCKSQGRMGKSMHEFQSIPYFDPPLIYDPDGLDIAGNLIDATYLNPRYVLDQRVGEWPESEGHKRKPRRSALHAPPTTRASSTQEARLASFASSHDTLSAEYVCSRTNVAGPNYVNILEGKFCRMDDRTVWDVCIGGSTSNCFDTDKEILYGPRTTTASNDTMGISSAVNILLSMTSTIKMKGSS